MSYRRSIKFQKYAIILNEPQLDIKTDEQEHQENDDFPSQNKTSPPTWTKHLLPDNTEEKYQDVGQLSKILEEAILTHTTEAKVSTFTGQEIIQENSAALVPLIFRVAVENFAKRCRSQFKIIQCPHETKLSSDWKPSLPETLIARNHQVIIVDLKEPFLSHVNFAYAILRQLNHEWKTKLPQSLFYPKDVCTRTIYSRDKSLIMLTPSMPDGDFDLSRIPNQLQRDLVTMFKQICMNALSNTLHMQDLGFGNSEEIVAAFARIRVIYRRVQRALNFGQYLLIEPESCQELIVQMSSIVSGDLATADTVLEIGERLFDLGTLPQINSGRRSHSEFSPKSKMSLDGCGDRSFSNGWDQNYSHELSIEERVSMLDEKLKSQFGRIQSMLSAVKSKERFQKEWE